VREAFKSFSDAATGRWAVSLPAFLLIIPFGALVGVERESAFNPDFPYSQQILIVAAGYFSSFIYIFLAQHLFLGDRKERKQPLWRCIFVWYSTGAVWGLMSTAYAHIAFEDKTGLLSRLPLPIFYSGTALALMAYYFGVIDKRRIQADALRKLELMLETDRDELHQNEILLRKDARSALESNMSKQLIELQALLTLPQNQRENLTLPLERLQEYSFELAKVVKQEIASLSGRTRVHEPSVNERDEGIPLWRGLFPKVLSVKISMLAIGFGAFVGQFPRNGIEGVTAGAVGTVILGLTLFGLARLAKGKTFGTFPLFIPFSYLTVFLVQALWTAIQSTVGFVLNDPYNPFYSGLKTVYGVFLASLISELITSTTDDLGDSRVRNAEINDQISQLSKNEKVLKRTLLEARYGKIQGKISGVVMAIRLLQSDAGSIERQSQLVLNAQKQLVQALEDIPGMGRTDES
jgi:hypothetical protein